MSDGTFTESRTPLADQYGYLHHLTEELARGGQGVVYRTKDADLAVKQPLDVNGEPDLASNPQARFQNVRSLPLPPRIPISLPLATLRDQPGYVMKLLSEMEPFGAFELSGDKKEHFANAPRPKWLDGVKDNGTASTLAHYAQSGSTRRRLFTLSKVAGILARLHAAGLVYGDIAPNNCFMGKGESQEVWLIDADNLRFERIEDGNAVYTPRYGAPEVVQGRDRARPRTDCWAFAVMAFETLSLVHPFIGRKVLDPDEDAGGWDVEPVLEGAPADLDEQAYAGFLPFVDDENDDSNPAMSGLPRAIVLTPELARLFQETFGAGRTKPWRRPAMAFWAVALTAAYDQSIACPSCEMSYYKDNTECPFCNAHRPPFVLASTDRWQTVIQQPRGAAVDIPHRLFHAFSFELSGRTEYEAEIDVQSKSATNVRGTSPFPAGLSIEFIGGAR